MFEELLDALPAICENQSARTLIKQTACRKSSRHPTVSYISQAAASLRGLHARASNATSGWSVIAESSSARMPGSLAWANDAPASTSHRYPPGIALA
nr:hypothetical protein [Xanthomonas bromi]